MAGALSYSVEDVSLALGLMANSSVKGSMAGTSLKTALLNMTSPTKAMAGVMSQYGISLTDTNGEMYSLGEMIAQLRDKMGGLDETTQAAAASTLFGKEAATGMLAIINASAEDYEKLTSAINDCNGAAERMAEIMEDNLQGDLTKLGSAFESLQIAISDSLTPTLREFAQFGQKAMANLLEGFQGGGVSGFMSALSGIVTDGAKMLAQKAPEFASVSLQFVQALADGILGARFEIFEAGNNILITLSEGISTWISDHSTEMQEFGIGMVRLIFQGFLAAGDIISENIGQFVPLIATAFATYHESLFTVGLDILGAIGQGIIDNKEEIQDIASETITNMATSLRDNAPDIIEGGLALLEALVGAIRENLPLILETGAEIIGQLVAGIATAGPEVQAIIGVAVLPHILKIVDTVSSIGGAVTDVVKLVVGENGIKKVLDIGKTLMGGIKSLFALIAANPVVAIVTGIIAAVVLLYNKCEWFRDGVNAVIDAVVGFFQNAWEAVQAAWQSAGEFFGGIVDSVKGAFDGIGEFLGGLFESAWEAVSGAWDAAVDFFSGIGDGIHEAFEAVTSFLGDAFSSAWDAVSGAWDAAVSFFGDIWEGIKTAAGETADKIGKFLSDAWDAVRKAWEGAKDFFGGVVEGIVGAFSNIGGKFLEIGGNIVNGIKDGIGNAWNSFIGWLGSKVNGIVDAVKGMLGIHSPSKVFAGIGENMALGLAEGWDDEYNAIKRKIEGGMNFGTASVGLVANGTSYSAPRMAQNGPQAGFGGAGNTYVTINSPIAVDAVQAAREWKKTTQRMAMAY